MLSILIFLLAFYQLQRPVYTELPSSAHLNQNSLSKQDGMESSPTTEFNDINDIYSSEIPFIKTGPDRTEVEFHRPITAVNIDYPKNALLVRFRKQHQMLDPEELEQLKSLESNFMRFGRDQGPNFMRFGKRSIDQKSTENSVSDVSSERFARNSDVSSYKSGKLGLRDSRADNFMRLGRNAQYDFMRFGRDAPKDFMRFGRSFGQDFMRFGRNPGQNYMRFGRNPGQNYMRFGRNPGQDYMRFGRNPGQDYMRFGRNPGQDYMRFGRNPGQDYMRFGRNPGQDYMRFGRNPNEDFMRFDRSTGEDFMRFGKSPADFMRLGRSSGKEFMRFDRSGSNGIRNSDKNFMRFGRPDNFMRLGRANSDSNAEKSSNFMRFGRMDENGGKMLEGIDEEGNNRTSTRILQKNIVKEAAKLLRETDPSDDESNPMDKAIQVLFRKNDSEQHKNGEDNLSQELMDY